MMGKGYIGLLIRPPIFHLNTPPLHLRDCKIPLLPHPAKSHCQGFLYNNYIRETVVVCVISSHEQS